MMMEWFLELGLWTKVGVLSGAFVLVVVLAATAIIGVQEIILHINGGT